MTGPDVVLKSPDYLALQSALCAEAMVRFDEPLARKTTLRVGGPADCYVEPASEEDLAVVLRFCASHNVPVTMMGRGSNLLIRDGGIRGVVLCLNHPSFCAIAVSGHRLTCGAGARLKAVANEARRHGVAGLEFLEGIPGSVGGALRMNAGAMGAAMFERVRSMRFMDRQGGTHERAVTDIPTAYRSCPLLKTHFALSAVLEGTPDTPEAIQERMTAFSQKRWDTQPAAPSAGCIFKNPSTIGAGKLIDELGLKGTRIGQAVVSEVHGNFFVNQGGATAADLLRLIEVIRTEAKAQRQVDLETEVQILGEDHGAS